MQKDHALPLPIPKTRKTNEKDGLMADTIHGFPPDEGRIWNRPIPEPFLLRPDRKPDGRF